MSQVAISGNASGTGTLTIAAPNTNSNYTLTLPTATTTFVGTDATQTLTNKTIQGGAITSGTAVASTSGTAIDFTGIPSWAKRITVMLNGVSLNGASEVMIQIGTGGSPTTSGYAGRAAFAGVSAGTVAFSAGFITFVDASAANLLYGQAILCLLNSSTNNWTYSGITGASDIAYTTVGGGGVSLSGVLNMVRITTVNGTDTFDAGSINIMYEG